MYCLYNKHKKTKYCENEKIDNFTKESLSFSDISIKRVVFGNSKGSLFKHIKDEKKRKEESEYAYRSLFSDSTIV